MGRLTTDKGDRDMSVYIEQCGNRTIEINTNERNYMTTRDEGIEILGWNDKGNVILNHKAHMLLYVGDSVEYTLYFKHYALERFKKDTK